MNFGFSIAQRATLAGIRPRKKDLPANSNRKIAGGDLKIAARFQLQPFLF
jgi:hypothetical protein